MSARPPVAPEDGAGPVVEDRNSEFIGTVSVQACALGVRLIPCRPYDPTDKTLIDRRAQFIRTRVREKCNHRRGGDVL